MELTLSAEELTTVKYALNARMMDANSHLAALAERVDLGEYESATRMDYWQRTYERAASLFYRVCREEAHSA